MFRLGSRTVERRRGVEVDIGRALDLLTQVADGGDLEARRRLSDLLAMSDPLQ